MFCSVTTVFIYISIEYDLVVLNNKKNILIVNCVLEELHIYHEIRRNKFDNILDWYIHNYTNG